MRPGNTVEVEISGIVREARRLSRSGARLHSRFDHRCADRRQAKIAEQGVLYSSLVRHQGGGCRSQAPVRAGACARQALAARSRALRLRLDPPPCPSVDHTAEANGELDEFAAARSTARQAMSLGILQLVRTARPLVRSASIERTTWQEIVGSTYL